MGSNRKILLLFAACLAVGAGLLFALYGGAGGPEAPIEVIAPQGVGPEIDVVSRATREELAGPSREVEGEEPTEIFFPLELSLSLVEPAKRLAADGVGAHGSGARARLEGHLFGSDTNGVAGEVRFTSGANMGRVLKCDAGGGFGAHDLYPGLSIVKISGPMIAGAEREVLLRNDRKSVLNIGFGRPAVVHGRVQDEAGDPIVGARVTMDGQETFTDIEGAFYYPRMTSGQVLLFVEMDGYVAWRERPSLETSSSTRCAQGRGSSCASRRAWGRARPRRSSCSLRPGRARAVTSHGTGSTR